MTVARSLSRVAILAVSLVCVAFVCSPEQSTVVASEVELQRDLINPINEVETANDDTNSIGEDDTRPRRFNPRSYNPRFYDPDDIFPFRIIKRIDEADLQDLPPHQQQRYDLMESHRRDMRKQLSVAAGAGLLGVLGLGFGGSGMRKYGKGVALSAAVKNKLFVVSALATLLSMGLIATGAVFGAKGASSAAKAKRQRENMILELIGRSATNASKEVPSSDSTTAVETPIVRDDTSLDDLLSSGATTTA